MFRKITSKNEENGKTSVFAEFNGYSSPKYATIPPKVRHLFLGKVRH